MGAFGGSCSCTTEDFLNEFGCSGEQPSSFILHDRKFERIRQRRSAAGGSCSCTTEDFLNEFGCSGEQPSSFILHDQNLNEFGSAGALLEGRAPARPKNFRRLCRSTALQRPQFFGLPICRFHDLPIRFGSAGASPSHHSYALRFTHYAHILSVPFMA
ncbi:MAG: hypothetical protein OGMRLDGQ_000378 [Candidatus Fervidibacter sp.]